MKLKKLFFFSFTLLSLCMQAQDFLGFVSSNYSGVTGTDLQPAAVVDSRFKFDMNLIGFNIGIGNNYVGMKRKALTHQGSLFNFSSDNYTAFKDTNFAQNYLNLRENDKSKSLYFTNQLQMLSFMVNISNKSAFAFKWKIRTMINFDGLSSQLASLMYHGLDYPDLLNLNLHNENLSFQTMTWAEYGLTYGIVLKDKGSHFLKVGATVKLIQGLQAAYLYVHDLDYNFSTKDTLSLFHTDASYGHSDNFDFSTGNVKYKFVSNPSVALDLGVVYEWRPDYKKYVYDLDGQQNFHRRDVDKYKLRAGISLLDLGSVKFKKGEYSRNFTADINYWDIHHINPTDVSSLDDTLRTRFKMDKGDEDFKMHLPTVISAQIDYNIWKGIYINLTPFYSLKFKNLESKVHSPSLISITPRYDSKWFGIYVPVSRDDMQNTKVGLGLRIGPLIIGTANISPLLSKKDIYSADFYTIIKIPLIHKVIHDKDRDHVSDKLDRCPDVPGVWEFYGCPDRDGDHVEDKDDNCPDDAGLPEFKGCPDRDNDRVIDKLDDCPDVPGLAKFNGCPDKDGDGVIDKNDECPDEAGLEKFKGCPDKDGDGIMDKNDQCPERAGPESNNGCPEVKLSLVDKAGNPLRSVLRNKDESFYFDDLPPDEQVLFKLEGNGVNIDDVKDIKVLVGSVAKRALKDSKDGYFHFIVLKTDINKADQQEAIDVPIKLNITQAAVVKKAFSNLEFTLGKDVIKKESYPSLDELAGMLTKNPKWKLKISGHTDNAGEAADNMKLSKGRAEAVKNYLIKKGVNESRLKAEWFGMSKPVADNNTEAGRQKNRRVELLLIE